MPDPPPAHVDVPRIDIVNAFFPSRIVGTQHRMGAAGDRLCMGLHRLNATEKRKPSYEGRRASCEDGICAGSTL